MPDLPHAVEIQEEGPREGFQIEPGPISTAKKIELIDALSETGLKEVQVASFVNPKRVPDWADAEEVVEGIARKEGVRYTGLWLNERGFLRAVEAGGLHLKGSITTVASETFLQSNQNMTPEDNNRAQHNLVTLYKQHDVPVTRGYVQAAFGCNFQGDVSLSQIMESVETVLAIAAEHDVGLRGLNPGRYHGLGHAPVHQAGGGRCAGVVAGAQDHATPPRHPRHGYRQRVRGARDGGGQLRRQRGRSGRLPLCRA